MRELRPAVLPPVVFILLIGVGAAQAQWATNGAVVTTAAADQTEPRIVTDGRGGALIVWTDLRGGNSDIYCQRLDVFGTRQWGVNDTPICDDGDAQLTPSLVTDGDGGLFSAWWDDRGTSYHTYAQHMDADGLPVWIANGHWVDTGSSNAQMAPDGTGGAFICWQEASTYPTSIAVQRLSTTGAKVWAGDYTIIGTSLNPYIVADGTGGFLAGWARYTSPSYAYWVYGMRLDAAGNNLWADTTISPSYGCTFDAQIATDGAGGGFWVYTEGTDVIANYRDAAGNFPWGAGGVSVFPSHPGGTTPQVVADGGGGVIVVADIGGDIRANRILANGSLDWTTLGTNVCDDPALQEAPQLAPDGDGGAYIVWEDHRDSGTTGIDIYAQHVGADGIRNWNTNGRAICWAAFDQTDVRITATGTGSAIIAWQDDRNAATTSADIYAQAVHFDGSVGDPPFEVLSIAPARNALDQPRNTGIHVEFNLPVAAATVLGANLLVHGSLSGLHDGALTPSGDSGLDFNPDADFDHGETVIVVLNAGFESIGGNPLKPAGFAFTTEAEGVAGQFLAAVNHAVGTRPFGLCAADLQADGYLDLVVANFDDDTISILAGTGDGGFASQSTLNTATRPHDVKAADLDEDGDMDLIGVEYGNATIRAYLNNGSGGFPTATLHHTGANPEAVCVGDFDNDGHLDLATADLGADAISVFLGNGLGSFGPATAYAAGDNPMHIACGDVNGDHYLDLFTANFLSDGVSMFINQGDGTFNPSVELLAGDGPMYVQLADLDGDGDLDLVISAALANQILVRLNNNGNGFGMPVPYTTGAAPYAGPPADVDGDGDLDLVYANGNSNNVSVRLNDGSGNFGPATSYAAGSDPVAVLAADFDGDGALDIAASNRYSDEVTVFLNHHSLSGTEPPEVPAVTGLGPNVPNPFNPGTRIDYTLREAGHVRLVVYDVRGREIATLVDAVQPAREHSVRWDGRDQAGRQVASGTYFYKLLAGEVERTRKMVLLR